MGMGGGGTREGLSAQPGTPPGAGWEDRSSSLALLIIALNKSDEAGKSETGEGKGERVWFSIAAAAAGTAGGSPSAPREPHSFRARGGRG